MRPAAGKGRNQFIRSRTSPCAIPPTCALGDRVANVDIEAKDLIEAINFHHRDTETQRASRTRQRRWPSAHRLTEPIDYEHIDRFEWHQPFIEDSVVEPAPTIDEE